MGFKKMRTDKEIVKSLEKHGEKIELPLIIDLLLDIRHLLSKK